MKTKQIAILDYGIGNVKSISNAFNCLGTQTILTNDRNSVLSADAVVLPGVGAFAHGMENLDLYHLIPLIHEFVNTGKPFMGICLGMQMLLEESEEFGITKGIGLIKGRVIKLPLPPDSKEKLPHVSWNELHRPKPERWQHTILKQIEPNTNMYFVHSFVATPQNAADILATTNYGGVEFCSAVHKDNIYGVQFHPEKSGKSGLTILTNFINLI